MSYLAIMKLAAFHKTVCALRHWLHCRCCRLPLAACHTLHRQSHWIFMALPAQIMRLQLKQLATKFTLHLTLLLARPMKCNLVYELRAKNVPPPQLRLRPRQRQRFAHCKMNLAVASRIVEVRHVARCRLQVQTTLSAANFLLSLAAVAAKVAKKLSRLCRKITAICAAVPHSHSQNKHIKF